MVRHIERRQFLAAGAVGHVEPAENRTVEIEHAEHYAALDQRHDELRARQGIAGDMAREFVHIRRHDRLAARRSRAAHA